MHFTMLFLLSIFAAHVMCVFIAQLSKGKPTHMMDIMVEKGGKCGPGLNFSTLTVGLPMMMFSYLA